MKKIAVIGPESTGKSTLSEGLGDELHTQWVPEFARSYLEQLGRPYVEDDLLTIAKGQIHSEDQLTDSAHDFLICDTDLYVLKVWSEHKYGRCDSWILSMIAERKYDLYLLTYIDIDWQEDPLREHPDARMRQYFYNIYKNIAVESGVPWVEVKGDPETRLRQAMKAIKKL
jgi:NadR type nicotinamide-nucleotide adenylyltransferase